MTGRSVSRLRIVRYLGGPLTPTCLPVTAVTVPSTAMAGMVSRLLRRAPCAAPVVSGDLAGAQPICHRCAARARPRPSRYASPGDLGRCERQVSTSCGRLVIGQPMRRIGLRFWLVSQLEVSKTVPLPV